MSYKLYDVNGTEIIFHDLQDKGPWCQIGASHEEVFIERYGKQLNLTINPEKKEDAFAPDLLNTRNGKLGDLKMQNTPFFQARIRFGLDPQFTVVFNDKDRERYRQYYPDIDIYFWVEWIVVCFVSKGQEIVVKPMSGVWYIPFPKLNNILETAPLHYYRQRINDTRGNAKSSYVISLKSPGFHKLI